MNWELFIRIVTAVALWWVAIQNFSTIKIGSVLTIIAGACASTYFVFQLLYFSAEIRLIVATSRYMERSNQWKRLSTLRHGKSAVYYVHENGNVVDIEALDLRALAVAESRGVLSVLYDVLRGR